MSGPKISLENETGRVNIFYYKTEQNNHLSTIPGGYFSYYLFEESSTGSNQELRVYGNPTGASGVSYGSLQVVGEGGNFEIRTGGSSSNILLTPGTTAGVGIGTATPQGKLDVNGPIYQRGGQLHADYVFEPDYRLESIEEHSKFMWSNRHLTAMPGVQKDESGQEVIEMGSHRRGIVEELEKAHIYIEQ